MTAARRPEPREQILEAAVASLTEADIPPAEQDGWLDPDADPPADLIALPDAELEELLAAAPARPPPPPWPLSYPDPGGPGGAPWPAGSGPEDGTGAAARFASGSAGFAGGAGGRVRRGRAAGCAGRRDAAGRVRRRRACPARRAADDKLIGVLRAWRRQASWAQARELATVAALARRRPAGGSPPAGFPGEFPARLSEFIAAEVAAALTLTGCAAGAELDLALDLAARPAVAAALEAGQIDLPRARILTAMLGPMYRPHADAVEARVLPRAAAMTTGQLRAALHRAVLAVDPDAARRRREEAGRAARVEHWADPEGTASLAGRGLPPAAALTASSRLTQIATTWKQRGAAGGMDLLRAYAYLALLNGQPVDTPPPSLLPPELAPGSPGPGECHPVAGGGPAASQLRVPAGLRGPGPGGPPPAAGLINLTVPLTTLLGLADTPGQAAGYGPLDAAATRLLARALAGHPATR